MGSNPILSASKHGDSDEIAVLFLSHDDWPEKRTCMGTIYRSEKGRQAVLDLYDSQLSRLERPWRDLYVETSFGRTRLIETGRAQRGRRI